MSWEDAALKAREAAWQDRALTAIGLGLVAQASRLAPVDTGLLRNSIDKEVEGDTVRVGSPLKYANIQEINQGYLVGALDYIAPQIDNILQRVGEI